MAPQTSGSAAQGHGARGGALWAHPAEPRVAGTYGALRRRGRCSWARVPGLLLLALLLRTTQALEQPQPKQHLLSARVRQLDFCTTPAWSVACMAHPRRLFCDIRFEAFRQAIVSYCKKHATAVAEVAKDPEAARKYKYVLSQYDHGGGLGNRLPGMISGFFLALMTDRIFIHNYDGYDKYFSSPLNMSYQALMTSNSGGNLGLSSYWNFLHENYTMTNVMIKDNLTEKFGHFHMWVINGHADWHAAPLSANRYFKERMRLWFPTYEIFWPLSLILFRYNERLQRQVEDFQVRHSWDEHAVVGVQIRTRKMGSDAEVFHRFGDLTRSLIAEAQGQSKPIMVFLSSDSKEAYTEMRKRIKDWDGIHILGTGHEALAATNKTVGDNPGTEDSALLDLALLSHSSAIIISGSSSFGGCAAAMGGLHPFYITQLDGNRPGATALMPSYWKATSSDPCHYQGWWNDYYLDDEAMALWRAHPLHNQWRQCHGPHGGPETEEQKMVKVKLNLP